MDLPPRDRDEIAAYAIQELGAWLRDWRIQTGRSQRTLATWAGIDQSGISRLERGLTRVSSDRLARLVVALDWFSGGGDPSSPWASIRLPPGAIRLRPAGGGPPRVLRSVVYHPDGDAWGDIEDEDEEGPDDAWGLLGDEDDDGSLDAWGVIADGEVPG